MKPKGMLNGLSNILVATRDTLQSAPLPEPDPDRLAERTSLGKVTLVARTIGKAQEATAAAQAEADVLRAKLAALEARVSQHLELDLNDLVIVPGRRRRLTPEEFSELKRNLAHNPLSSPISVRALGQGRYELVAGHNRAESYRELGRTHIPAVVLSITTEEASRLAFYSNLLAPKLTAYQRFVGLRTRMAEGKLTQVQVAEESGLSEQAVSNLMAFAKLPADYLTQLEMAEDTTRFGQRALLVFLKLTPAELARALPSLPKVLRGEMTPAAAISLAKEKPQPKAPPPSLQVRLGKKVACDIVRRGTVVNLSFAQADLLTDELIQEIHALVSQRAKAHQEMVKSKA